MADPGKPAILALFLVDTCSRFEVTDVAHIFPDSFHFN